MADDDVMTFKMTAKWMRHVVSFEHFAKLPGPARLKMQFSQEKTWFRLSEAWVKLPKVVHQMTYAALRTVFKQ